MSPVVQTQGFQAAIWLTNFAENLATKMVATWSADYKQKYKIHSEHTSTFSLAILETKAAPTVWSSKSLLRQLIVTAGRGVGWLSPSKEEWPDWWLIALQNCPERKKMYHQGSKIKQNITLANTMVFIKNLIISDLDCYLIQDLNNIIYDSMFHLPIWCT